MANLGEVQVPIAAAAKGITVRVRVTGVGRWRVRLWVALKLIRLATWIAGMGLEVRNGASVNGES